MTVMTAIKLLKQNRKQDRSPQHMRDRVGTMLSLPSLLGQVQEAQEVNLTLRTMP